MRGVPPDLRPLFALVREASASCALRGRYEPLPGGNAAMRGQCENAAALFHLLAGGTAAGWRMMRIGPEAWPLGPHYFVRHVSGVVVDPTADQFPPGERVPYDLARGQSAGGFRRVPPGTRVGSVGFAGQTATPEALRAALRLPSGPAAAAASLARQWAGLHAPAGRRKNSSDRPPVGRSSRSTRAGGFRPLVGGWRSARGEGQSPRSITATPSWDGGFTSPNSGTASTLTSRPTPTSKRASGSRREGPTSGMETAGSWSRTTSRRRRRRATRSARGSPGFAGRNSNGTGPDGDDLPHTPGAEAAAGSPLRQNA